MLKTISLFFCLVLMACTSEGSDSADRRENPDLGVSQASLQGPSPITVPNRFTAGDLSATPVETVVDFPRMFALDETEVTVDQYGDCVTEGTCTTPDTSTDCNWGVGGRGSHPVNCVSFQQAVQYCAWAGKRLPTRHEWEYAAQFPDKRLYPWGNSTSSPETRGNTNNGSDGYSTTAPVGSYPAGDSALGLKDMLGNVWEWTQSIRCQWEEGPCNNCPTDETCSNACDVCGGSSDRAIKGGGYGHAMSSGRNPYVTVGTATSQSPYFGFRCAVTIR